MKKRLSFALALLLVLALFAGCSSSSTGGETSAGAPDAGNGASAGEASGGGLDVVKIILPRDIEVLDDAHYVAAQKMGYYEEEGIELQFEKSSGTSDMTMVSVGNGDICLPDSTVTLIGLTNDIPLIGIYQQDVCNTAAFCVQSGNSEINSIEDFGGKTIALGDASWSVAVDAILIAAGLTPDDVEYVVAGENRAQMVNEGKCDIVYTWEKGYQLWLAQGMDFKVITAKDTLDIPGNPLLTSRENFEENKDVLERFLRATAKGVHFMACNPEAATEIVLERFPTINVDFEDALEVIKASVMIMTNEDTEQYGYGYSNRERWERCVEYALLSGAIEREIGYDEIITNDLIAAANNFDRDAVEADAEGYELKNN